jgi:hypothetical protein
MYWGNGFTVGVAEPDGTQASGAFPTGGSMALRAHGPVCGVAVSATHLYWNEYGTIARVDLNGGTPQAVAGASSCGGIAVDAQHLYWASRDGSIGRANLDGSEANPRFLSVGGSPCGVAVGGGYVYWIGGRYGSSLGRARTDGTGVEPELVDGGGTPGCGIAVDSSYVYWAGYGGIARAGLDGTGANPVFIPGYSHVSGLATWGPYLYWTEEGHPGTIGRADLDGSAPNREFLLVDGTSASGIAFDARPAPLRTSSPIEIAKVQHAKGRGIAYVTVTVPGRGLLTARAKGAESRILNDNRPLWRVGPFELKLKLWPGRRGREATRVRNQLRREGRARVFLHLTYVEEGAKSTTTGKYVELVRKRRG